MHILEHKKRTHIASYIISMWHVEDLIRAHEFDLEKVLAALVTEDADPEDKTSAMQVYGGMLDHMKKQNLQRSGHLTEVVEALGELQFLHDTLLQAASDKAYLELYNTAKPGIADLQNLGDSKGTGEMEACFNGIYGILILRAKGTEISEATLQAEKHIRTMLDGLSERYREVRSFPDVSLN